MSQNSENKYVTYVDGGRSSVAEQDSLRNFGLAATKKREIRTLNQKLRKVLTVFFPQALGAAQEQDPLQSVQSERQKRLSARYGIQEGILLTS